MKTEPSEPCMFCRIVDRMENAHIIYEDSYHLSFLDRYPIDRGHALLVPKAHSERVTDMRQDDVERLFGMVPRIASAIMRATGAVAFTLAQNNGPEARQIVPHVHIHIIVRYRGRGTEWAKRGMPGDSALASLAEKIRSGF